MRWWRIVPWTAPFVMLVGLVAMANLDKPISYILMVIPIAWVVAGNAICCPRCGKHVQDAGRGYYAAWIKVPETCIGCGRDKHDIWPFQRLLRPEPNDVRKAKP